MYSDNGTNFVGAYNELKRFKKFLSQTETQETIRDELNSHFIQWHFNPPKAPHFGGLWEAGVKSMKAHLKHLSNNSFTFEEYNTILVQIESILNSRPLTPLSTDPTDLNPLTPSHFLIGEKSSSLEEPDYAEVPVNNLSRWQYLQQSVGGLWRRWSREYLQELQCRAKWSKKIDFIPKVGTLVIISEPNQPPCQWRLGRILELHPGADGVTRVVSVRTSNGTIKRALHYLAPLPAQEEVE